MLDIELPTLLTEWSLRGRWMTEAGRPDYKNRVNRSGFSLPRSPVLGRVRSAHPVSPQGASQVQPRCNEKGLLVSEIIHL